MFHGWNDVHMLSDKHAHLSRPINLSCSGVGALKCDCLHAVVLCSIIGLPDEQDWPRTISLPRDSFPYTPQIPVEEIAPELSDEHGKELLEVRVCH